MLLSRADVVAAAKIDSNREMLLHVAVRQGDEDMIRLLLSKGFDVNAQCDRGDTALQCAVDRAHDGVVTLLLSQPDVRPDLANKKGDTPGSVAAHSGRIETLRLLLAAGVDTETRNEEGLTPLCLAAEQGYGSIVKLLLTTDGIDADSKDNDGRTPLSLAASPSWGRRYWHSTSECDADHCGVIRCFMQSGRVDVNSRDKVGRTPLIHAAMNPQGLPALRTLLDHQGVDVNAVDEQGRTALAWDVGMWFEDKATLLLEKGADPRMGRFEADETLLSCAAKEGKVEVVLAFVSQHGVDPQERNEDGHTAICMAVKNGRTKVVETLLDVGGVEINTRCGHGQTPMHHAAERGEEEVASLLLARGNVDLDARDENGRTPLHYAAEWWSEKLVPLLLKAGVADPNHRDIEGRTPLSLAAQAGRLQTVEKLLSVQGVIPDTGDNTGRTPLSWAVQSNPEQASQAVVKTLLNTEGVDPNAEDERGWTPLSWAVQGTNAGNLVEFLLNEGFGRIDINHEDRKGRTPLALALQRGDEVVVGQLRAAGAKLKKSSDAIREEEQNDERRGLDDGEARDGVINEQEEGAADTMSEVSEEGPWQGSRRKGHWKRDRRRWMDADWFEDDSGDDSDKETKWSGTNDQIYRRTRSPVKEAPIELGPQVEEDQPEHVIGDDGELCPRCEKLDLDLLFSPCPRGGFGAISPLGKVDETWELRPCAMCRLIAAVRPRLWDADNCELCAYSSTATWLSRGKPAAQRYFRSNWVDTVVLGVESSSSWRYSSFNRGYTGGRGPWMGYSNILPYGFIGRIGANDHRQLRSITVHQLKVDSVDFERARGWISYCKAHHRRRCHPKNSSTRGSIASFRLIDCTTREIVDGQSGVDEFVALSYVWGPQPEQAAAIDHFHVENAEPVVEDAIRIHRIAATRYPIQEYARVFTDKGRGRFGSDGLSIWPVIEEYTQRRLTHEHDILNAMLGILQVYADRKSPVYHLCGVPLVRQTSGESHDPTFLEALATGLCWRLSEGGTRRPGFPSWSWTGWKGKVCGPKVSSISFQDGLAIEVEMLPRDEPPQALSWAEFAAMTPKQKASLPQNYDLKITATAVEVSLQAESPYDLAIWFRY
ncbi:ankyrin repeat-containing, partial [Fusarium albosuccineum]